MMKKILLLAFIISIFTMVAYAQVADGDGGVSNSSNGNTAGIEVERCINPSSLDIRVCAKITYDQKGLAISNITPNIQKSNKVAKDLCESFGSQISEYKVKVTTKKSCNYYAIRGFFKGDMVSGCLDFGGLGSGRTFSKIKCKEVW